MRCGQIMVKCREISLWIYPQGNNIGMHAPFPRAVDACAVRYVVWLYWTSVLTSCVHQYTVHVVGYSSVDILVAYTVVFNSLPQCVFCWQWQREIFFSRGWTVANTTWPNADQSRFADFEFVALQCFMVAVSAVFNRYSAAVCPVCCSNLSDSDKQQLGLTVLYGHYTGQRVLVSWAFCWSRESCWIVGKKISEI